MDLTIVIVNWNGRAVLQNCLGSIYGASQDLAFEVIVVDNASRDDSVAMMEREFPQVRVIRNRENVGFAAANNQAFDVAQGRYTLLLNNDTLLLPGALADSVRFLDANPDVGALGCRVEFPDRSFQTSCYRFTNLVELFMIRLLPLGSVANERLNFGRYWGRQFSEPTDVDVVAGCFLIVRRQVIDDVGALDEDFFMYGEDEEWCSRIKCAGWRIVYFPRATIIHIHRYSSGKVRRAASVAECMSPVLVLHKRRGATVAWAANVILLVATAVRLPAWLILDLWHARRAPAQELPIRARLHGLATHAKGVLRPVWIPNRSSRLTGAVRPVPP
ncbi:MAG: glycosyltransferase family 2 protein [Lentisphaerae bacterium]|nr:glycosyltransferase family 2 protein [Lentisphaerota bacterium]